MPSPDMTGQLAQGPLRTRRYLQTRIGVRDDSRQPQRGVPQFHLSFRITQAGNR